MTTTPATKHSNTQPTLIDDVWHEPVRMLEVNTPWVKGQRHSWAFLVSNRVPRSAVISHIRKIWEDSDYSYTKPIFRVSKRVIRIPINEVHTRETIENDILQLGAD